MPAQRELNIAHLLDEALALHRSGRGEEAAVRYERILQAEPENASALHLLGLVALQRKNLERARELIEQAVSLKPDHAAYRSNLGNVLRELGRADEAIASFRQSLALDPELVDALSNLGAMLRSRNDLEEARGFLEKARSLAPANAAVLNNLASTLIAMGQGDAGIEMYRRALAADPRHAEAARNLGVALLGARAYGEAAAWLTLACVVAAGQPDAYAYLGMALHELGQNDDAIRMLEKNCEQPWVNGLMLNVLGTVLSERKRYQDAERVFLKALDIDPGAIQPLCNLGIALMQQRRYAEALERFALARELKPEDSSSYVGTGTVYSTLGRFEQAEREFRRAIELKPDAADAHLNLGLTLLVLGEFHEGWQEYEYRTRMKNWGGAHGPRWNGEDLSGSSLLVWPEQGAGDNIQFIRYLALVREEYSDARILFPVPESLRRLFRSYLEGLRVETPPHGSDVVITGYQIPLLSLPGLFDTSLESIPAAIPYLKADPGLERLWRVRLASLKGLRVGLAWAGNRDYAGDYYRSVPFEHLLPILEVPGISFVSLQKDTHSQSAAANLKDWMDQANDFADTAALISQLDLVISVDTSIAHLAGALGRPVWLLNRVCTDWRWLLEQRHSPWYPSMEIFRQATLGDWEPVVEELRGRLAECAQDRAKLLVAAR